MNKVTLTLNKDIILALGLIVLTIVILVAGPHIVLWSVNSLLAMADVAVVFPHTLKAWFCALMIMGLLGGSKVPSSS